MGLNNSNGTQAYSKGTDRSEQGPSCQLFSRSYGRQRPIQMASNSHGTRRLTILRRRLLHKHCVPNGLPIQTAQNELCDTNLSLQYQLQWWHLPRHFERSM